MNLPKFQALRGFVANHPTFVTTATILVVIVAGVLVGRQICHHHVDRLTAEARRLLLTSETPPPTSQPSDDTSVEVAAEKPPALRRLKEQYTDIVHRQHFHFFLMSEFYGNYYTTLSLAAMATILAAIALVSVSKTGWQSAHSGVISFFVLSAAAAAFFGAFPAVFKQEQNISDNKALFTAYTTMANQIRSYFATGKGSDGSWVPAPEFVRIIDEKLAKLMEIPVGFDSTRIPSVAELEVTLTPRLSGRSVKPTADSPRNPSDGTGQRPSTRPSTQWLAPLSKLLAPQ